MSEKVPIEVLRERLDDCPRGVFRHYKTGNLYIVVGAAISEATREPLVLYQPGGDARATFARPLAEWEAEVEHEGRMVKRFTRVRP